VVVAAAAEAPPVLVAVIMLGVWTVGYLLLRLRRTPPPQR
jgi:hypothetical protein